MPYLPPDVLQQTTLPEASGEDISTDIALIEDMWDLFPTVMYYSLDKRTTSSKDSGDNQINPDKLSGETGATKYDVLWGESVDSTKTTWVQPQGTNGVVQAVDVEVFKDPIPMKARVTVVREHQKLEKYGFPTNDKWISGLILMIPCSLLDKAGIYCGPGDKVLWDGDQFSVFAPKRTGMWHNTNIFLYVNLLCPRTRHGS